MAKVVVEAEHPGSKMRRIESQSAGEHDFDLLLPDGSVATVEVTAAMDEDARAATAAIFDRAAGGNPVVVGECRSVWIVELHPKSRIARVRTRIGGYLSRLEAAGIEHFVIRLGSLSRPRLKRSLEI